MSWKAPSRPFSVPFRSSLHLESLLPQPIPYYSVLSCGTPNAYAMGFSEGGLFDLLMQLKELRDHREPCEDASQPHKVAMSDKNRALGIRIRERFDLATSQAIAILAAAFVNDVGSVGLADC